MTLFEINDMIARCVKLEEGEGFLDTETGEVIDTEALAQLEMDRDEKIRNIACWIRNLESDEKQLAEQEKIFRDRKTACKNKRESLKTYLSEILDGAKWQNEEVKISWRRSESVAIANVNALPKEFLRFKDPEADKTAIKKALKAGQEIAGAALVEKNSIQVK